MLRALHEGLEAALISAKSSVRERPLETAAVFLKWVRIGNGLSRGVMTLFTAAAMFRRLAPGETRPS